MSVFINGSGTAIKRVFFNGAEQDTVSMNGVEVFSAALEFQINVGTGFDIYGWNRSVPFGSVTPSNYSGNLGIEAMQALSKSGHVNDGLVEIYLDLDSKVPSGALTLVWEIIGGPIVTLSWNTNRYSVVNTTFASYLKSKLGSVINTKITEEDIP